MIDFTDIKEITIPEGKVIRITCDGETLWETEKYTITYATSSVTLSNIQGTIYPNEPYTTTISSNNGYDIIVSVVMGETDITTTVYNSATKTITIPAVTGNVTITASEVLKNWLPRSTDTDGSIYNSIGYYNGKRWSASSNAVVNGNDSTSMTGFFPCKTGDILRVQDYTKQSGTNWYIVTFDDSQTIIKEITHSGASPSGSYVSPGYCEVTLNAATYGEFTQVRLSWGQFNENSIITVNQQISSQERNLYNPSEITLGYRYSGSPGSEVASSNYFITGYIPVFPGDIVRVITNNDLSPIYGSDKDIEKIAFYDSSKNILGSHYTESGAVKRNSINDTTADYYIGYIDNIEKESFYDNIAYVRFCISLGTAATAADAEKITSIKTI